MWGHRKLTTICAVVALVGGFLALGAPSVGAGTVELSCDLGQGDPQEGALNVRIEPAAVPPGESTIDFFTEVQLGAEQLDLIRETLGASTLEFSDAEVEIGPGTGVTGDNLVFNPSDGSVDVTGTLPDLEQGPFPGIFDVTAGIGEKVSFDLVRSQVTIQALDGDGNPLLGPDGLTLDCTPAGDPTAVEAFVLPPKDERGPVVPDVERTTPEDTPVSFDLLGGVEDGPVAPTDPASLKITADPSNGTASLADGTVTYTPNSGFTGDDQFVYEACTEEFVTVEGQNQIVELAVSAESGTFTLTVDGETTGDIQWNADPADVELALEGLASVGEGNVAVSGGPGDPGATTPYTVELTGDLAKTAVELTADGTNLSLGPQEPGSAEVSVTQEGTPDELGVVCNSGVVTITVTPEEVPTTVPATPTPTPQALQPTITG